MCCPGDNVLTTLSPAQPIAFRRNWGSLGLHSEGHVQPTGLASKAFLRCGQWEALDALHYQCDFFFYIICMQNMVLIFFVNLEVHNMHFSCYTNSNLITNINPMIQMMLQSHHGKIWVEGKVMWTYRHQAKLPRECDSTHLTHRWGLQHYSQYNPMIQMILWSHHGKIWVEGQLMWTCHHWAKWLWAWS